MSKNIYVGNLPFTTTSDDLRDWFAEHGNVTRAQVATDRDTGRSRGFGFVEMATPEAADEAINRLNGRDYEGRRLQVEKAKASPAGGGGRPARSGGGGFGRGGGGGGGRW
jgi:RNA recognition motif-containing protein